MRRNSLKRFVALTLLISMFACEFVVYAEPSTDDSGAVTDETGNKSDDAQADVTTGDTAGSSVNDEYVNEMIEKNYTKVSSK